MAGHLAMAMNPRSRNWLVAMLSVTVFSTATAFVMIGPLLIALASAFNTSITNVGHLAGAIGISWGITAPLVGPISDTYGRRRVALTGVALLTIGTLSSALAWDYWGLLACRLLTGIGGAMIPPNSAATIADHFAPAERGRPFGIAIAAANSATVIALPIVAVLGTIGGWRLPFIILGTYLVGIWVWHWFGFPPPLATAPRAAGFAAHFRAVAKMRSLWFVFLANVLFRTASFAVFTYLVAFLVKAYGMKPGQTAIPLGVVGAGAMLGSFIGGYLASSAQRLFWAAFGLVSGGLCVGVALSGGVAPWPVALLGSAGIVLLTVFEPVSWVMTAEFAGDSRATANGLLATSNQLGGIVGASVAGLILAFGGFAMVGLFCAACGIGAALIVVGIAVGLRATQPVRV
jgi:predicted MFS family arabinose efflux permease